MREWLRRRANGEEGTILLMVPAGLLVMVMLGAMAFDLSLAYAGERRIADLTAAWTNEALARIDFDGFYGPSQELRIDQAAARQAVFDAWRATVDPAIIFTTPPFVSFPDPATVTVRLDAQVPLLFLDAVPGVGARDISTISTASLVVSN